MVRDDLYITVPSFFRCPISLDVMKSPVSLCTGVTYDRTSIQRWLDSGNNTCPATMQVLQTKDLVPNHNLQRLIQIWSDSVKTRPPPTESATTTNNSLSRAEAKSLIQQLKDKLLLENPPPNSTSFLIQCTNKLILFAKQSEENCSFLAMADSGLIPLLISRFNVFSANVPVMEKLIRILYLLLKHYKPENDSIIVVDEGLVTSLTTILRRQGKTEIRVLVSGVLKMIADTGPKYKYLIGENEEIFGELLRLILNSRFDHEAMDNCLSCLISISMPKRNRCRLVRAGAVNVLSKALQEAETSGALVEKVLKLIEMVSTCKEGRVEICGDEKCVGSIVNKMLKVSNAATENGVTILWSLCRLFGDQKAQEAVAKSNGMAKILLLLQSNVSPAVRQMCNDLLKVFRVNSMSSCLVSSYDTKTTHIMPF